MSLLKMGFREEIAVLSDMLARTADLQSRYNKEPTTKAMMLSAFWGEQDDSAWAYGERLNAEMRAATFSKESIRAFLSCIRATSASFVPPELCQMCVELATKKRPIALKS